MYAVDPAKLRLAHACSSDLFCQRIWATKGSGRALAATITLYIHNSDDITRYHYSPLSGATITLRSGPGEMPLLHASSAAIRHIERYELSELSLERRRRRFLEAVDEPTTCGPWRTVGPIGSPHLYHVAPGRFILGRDLNERAACEVRLDRMQWHAAEPEARAQEG